MHNAIALQDIETAVEYSFVNDRGQTKTRQRAGKLYAGTVYSLDTATYDRLLDLGLIEASAEQGRAPD